MQEAREKQAAILKEAADTRNAIVEKAQDKAREEGARLLSDAKAQIETESRMPSAKSVDRLLSSLYRLQKKCSRLSSLTTRHRWI